MTTKFKIAAGITTISTLFFINLLLCSRADALDANYLGPFKGRVVDQESNQPIEGAVVHVDWHLTNMMSRQTYFDAKDVATDKNGYFYIPANWSILFWRNVFINSYVIILKAGYGIAEDCYGDGMDIAAEVHQHLTEEQRKKMGPSSFYNIRFEADKLPVFLLKKLTKNDLAHNFPVIKPDREAPLRKKRLFLEEINRQEEMLGWHKSEIK
jgi:hypothetical protein